MTPRNNLPPRNYSFGLTEIPKENPLDRKPTEYQLDFKDLRNPGSTFPLVVNYGDIVELYKFLECKIRNTKAILPPIDYGAFLKKSTEKKTTEKKPSEKKAETELPTPGDGVLYEVTKPMEDQPREEDITE